MAGRLVLASLVGIHFVLPFTPVNQHPEVRILVGSLILGCLFAVLAWRSLSAPRPAFLGALLLLGIVYVVSATTGASPIDEGWPIKLVFAAGLLVAFLSSDRESRSPAEGT